MANSRMGRLCATALFGLLLSTSAVPVIAQNLDGLAASGEVLAAADPRSEELRGRLDEAGQRGFDIGMGVAENHTLAGPGKQSMGEQLPADQQSGYFAAVLFSVTRNANATAANVGARIAQTEPALANGRRAEDDAFYALGFDIATGLLHDGGSNSLNEAAQRLGARTVHGSLTGATLRGFEASAGLHGLNYGSFPGKSTPITPPGDLGVSDGTTDGTSGDVRVGSVTDVVSEVRADSAGVVRVGSVPNVAGMTANEAHSILANAGYDADEVETNIGPVQPPYDWVIGTTPAAGTTLPPRSKVQYQLPQAWVVRGVIRLPDNDEGTRNEDLVGFDFDTGKIVRGIHSRPEIYAIKREYALPTQTGLGTQYGGINILTDVMVSLNLEQLVPLIERQAGLGEFEIKGRHGYEDCERSFRAGGEVRDRGGAGQYCLITGDNRTARIKIVGIGNIRNKRPPLFHDDTGYVISYVTFPGDASRTVKAQGRVVGPGAPVKPKLRICEMAKVARDRNSPAAPGLAQKCLASGGSIPPP